VPSAQSGSARAKQTTGDSLYQSNRSEVVEIQIVEIVYSKI
jgi:hypothetical protein